MYAHFVHVDVLRIQITRKRIMLNSGTKMKKKGIGWRCWVSNPGPSACKADTTTTELHPHSHNSPPPSGIVDILYIHQDNNNTRYIARIFYPVKNSLSIIILSCAHGNYMCIGYKLTTKDSHTQCRSMMLRTICTINIDTLYLKRTCTCRPQFKPTMTCFHEATEHVPHTCTS